MSCLTKEIFTERSRCVHKDKYTYDLVEYKNLITKVKITCKVHGIFEQIPRSHLRGYGCKKCIDDKRRTSLSGFIKKARGIHGDIYDYSLVKYKNSESKIKIICKTHGVFEQEAHGHLRGFGCRMCYSDNKRITHDEFLEKAKMIHGDRYDYNLSAYTTNRTYIDIICKKHGVFKQKPSNHLTGHGCEKCASDERRVSFSEFIDRSVKIHGECYDYSLVDLITTFIKVDIICKDHGVFSQYPISHMSGAGCPSCRRSKGEKRVSDYLVQNNITFETQKKFNNCICISYLFFDFYIPSLNLCIEYDGRQHSEITFFSKTQDKLNSIKNRDKIKEDYCDENGIKLLRISYKDFNLTEKILNHELYRR